MYCYLMIQKVSEILSRGGFYPRLATLVAARPSPAALLAARAEPRTEQYDIALPAVVAQRETMVAENVHHFFVRVR
jgi:hypothetical protein